MREQRVQATLRVESVCLLLFSQTQRSDWVEKWTDLFAMKVIPDLQSAPIAKLAHSELQTNLNSL